MIAAVVGTRPQTLRGTQSMLTCRPQSRHRGQPHPQRHQPVGAAGELVCLVGRNGAGKTTTFRSIMGLSPPAIGRISFETDLARSRAAISPDAAKRRGLAGAVAPTRQTSSPAATDRLMREDAAALDVDFEVRQRSASMRSLSTSAAACPPRGDHGDR